ncbi:hypothetical protein GJA_2895 [Janthinobacterium agaricidamnosum NBRC 102515 = DSM 9628]|uniref:Uncharacterized protein n=1 Tax=Janthinobacterium agaricidamnosum NBRC 102515 = DSM 9628 TaxID=1349767 RepID=W0V854_9BURK|nr:hypothetical protein GJA_2895 [Janthinobacterium agaricidamnosum NBRC 102515 = DSM 9628]
MARHIELIQPNLGYLIEKSSPSQSPWIDVSSDANKNASQHAAS